MADLSRSFKLSRPSTPPGLRTSPEQHCHIPARRAAVGARLWVWTSTEEQDALSVQSRPRFVNSRSTSAGASHAKRQPYAQLRGKMRAAQKAARGQSHDASRACVSIGMGEDGRIAVQSSQKVQFSIEKAGERSVCSRFGMTTCPSRRRGRQVQAAARTSTLSRIGAHVAGLPQPIPLARDRPMRTASQPARTPSNTLRQDVGRASSRQGFAQPGRE